MCRSLDLFVVSWLFLTVRSLTGEILPPQNVSLRWKSDFHPELSWEPPQHSVENCTYEVFSKTNEEHSQRTAFKEASPYSDEFLMEGGFLYMSIRTVCNGNSSEAKVINDTSPELVKNLMCYSTSSKQAHCSWEAATHIQDLRLYYWTPRNLPENESVSHHLKECRKTEDMTVNVCDVQPGDRFLIDIVVNGTLNNRLVRNTFRKYLKKDVRLPRLEWNVTKTGDKFSINWNQPNFGEPEYWIFKINYTECGEKKEKDTQGITSMELGVVPHCPYNMTIQAVCDEGYCNGETELSDWKYFDADKDPNVLVYPAIIIPLMLACLAALAFVCCRKNREKVFPKVPQPRDLLSDISDNNNKTTVHNLYIPPEEEENCKITLVIDPQISKPNSWRRQNMFVD